MNPLHHHKAANEAAMSAALARINAAMQQTERITQQVADEHFASFTTQMRQKVGVEEIRLNEPYLPVLLKRREVMLLERLEKLFNSVDVTFPLSVKSIDPDEPILSQVEERIDIETNRFAIDSKQELDGLRQQAFGIRKYIWRTKGDNRVRPAHAAKDGQIFTWGDGEEPGDVFGCRCSAEPILEDASDPMIPPTEDGTQVAV